MTIPTAEIPITDTYEDIKRLIYQICNGYVHSSDLNFEELVSEANHAFVKAYNKYDPERGDFTTLIHHAVNNHLKSLMRKRVREIKFKTNQENIETHIKKIRFTLHTFINSLSDDSKFIMKLIFDAPNDIKEMTKALGKDQLKWREFIGLHLFNLKWDQDRIDATFEEVKAAL